MKLNWSFIYFSFGSFFYFLMEAKAQYFNLDLTLTQENFYALLGKSLVFGVIVTGASFLGKRWQLSKNQLANFSKNKQN